MVKKLEKGATVTCYKCHGEGHKLYKYPQFCQEDGQRRKEEVDPTIKSSLIYTKPTARIRPRATPASSRRRLMARWLHTRLGR
jgi:hypothetical protein